MGGGGGVSKQLKIPPGGRFERGCKISFIFFGGGGGPGNLETPLATPLPLGSRGSDDSTSPQHLS